MWHWFSRAAVSSETADWLVECVSWAMQNFDSERFRQKTPLVLPTNDFFPKQVDSQHAMAEYIFGRVVHFGGIENWPWKVVPPEQFYPTPPPLLGLNPAVRGEGETPIVLPVIGQPTELIVTYAPDQIAKPQDLVASMAHAAAQHMLWQSQLTPPGGQEFFLQAAEVLAVFMGFGVMVTNSAYAFRGSCAKCYNPKANRQASLSESECLYALALFCDLQRIPRRKVARHLKSYLHPALKSAYKQIEKHPNTPHLRELAA